MENPIGKSVSWSERHRRLIETVNPADVVAVMISADPDALSSALALRRLFWRKVKSVRIFRINRIDRADNLAFVRLLDIRHSHVRSLRKADFTKFAIVDSQPSHHELFSGIDFNIVIDHHPAVDGLKADFIDIREDFGSNATLMTEYLKAGGIRPSQRLATALLYGIKSDTNNFVRKTSTQDMIAFRYLFDLANLNIIKKIESSDITRKTLGHIKKAIEELVFVKNVAVVHMGTVKNADILVIVADFFLRLAEAGWSIVSGVCGDKLVVIFRNAGFRRDAGKLARDAFGEFGSAGGHKNAARAEIPLGALSSVVEKEAYGKFVVQRIRKASA
ncbi:MAG: DHH family phosphoesterase [Desulfobacteraceae bacterium]|nr:DHH family phosphoesterase [Desulfobacteraceae bacterium]